MISSVKEYISREKVDALNILKEQAQSLYQGCAKATWEVKRKKCYSSKRKITSTESYCGDNVVVTDKRSCPGKQQQRRPERKQSESSCQGKAGFVPERRCPEVREKRYLRGCRRGEVGGQ